MSKANSSSAVEAISGLIQQRQPQFWHMRVAPEHAETLAEIRESWRSGRFGKRLKPAAVAISKYLTESGIASIGHNGVIAWLQSEEP